MTHEMKKDIVKSILALVLLIFDIMLFFVDSSYAVHLLKWRPAENAYKNFLRCSPLWFESNDGDLSYIRDRDAKYEIIDINGDGVPELIVLDFSSPHAMGYQGLYTYSDGEVVFVSAFDVFICYENGGLREAYINMGWGEESFYIFDGKSLDKICTDVSPMSLENKQNYSTEYYNSKGEEISESKFNELVLSVTAGKTPMEFHWKPSQELYAMDKRQEQIIN